ncbi:cytochrome P450 [Mycena leptocephala]|nr:cytochrome P450 [Mycena leptocephala]
MVSLKLSAFLCGVLGVSLISYIFSLRRNHSRLPLPPGLTKLPILGNLFDFPETRQWETFMELSKRYNSDIIHLNAAETSIIVLSSQRAVNELLEYKPHIYSDRWKSRWVECISNQFSEWITNQRSPMIEDCLKAQRSAKVVPLRPTKLVATHEFLRRTLQNPDHVLDHARHMAGRLIISVTYGIDVLPSEDPYIALVGAAVNALIAAALPGKFLVDGFPILKYVPEWVPGAAFKRNARKWKELIRTAVNAPFTEAKRKIVRDCSAHSLSSHPEYKDFQEMVKSAAASMHSASVDPTVSTLGTFILAMFVEISPRATPNPTMLTNPEAQRKAQCEIDAVVGRERLPQLEDIESLPHVSALLKEVLRPILPCVSVEDEYRGYRTPAGSIVIGNVICHEVTYPDPHSFKPERFLFNSNTPASDPMPCSDSDEASMLAVFDITKAIREDGEVIEPMHEYSVGLASSPVPFKYSIEPRSVEAAMLIQTTINEP